MASTTITAPLLLKLTVRVTGLRITALRHRVAASILALGCWVAGIDLVMETVEKGAQTYDPRVHIDVQGAVVTEDLARRAQYRT